MANNDPRIEQLERELAENRQKIEKLKEENKSLNLSIDLLEDKNQQFESLFYSSTSLLSIFIGPDHIIEIANDATRKLWGKGDDVIGKPLLEVLPELKDQGIIELLDQVYNTGEAYHADEIPVEFIIDGKSKVRYFDFTYQSQRNQEGEITGVASIANDVTKQALLNKKIKNSEIEFRKLVDFMPHKIGLSDKEGNPTYFNRNWIDYTGKSSEELLNQSYLESIHPDEREISAQKVEKSLREGSGLELEVRVQDKNGDYQWHLAMSTPIKDDNGEVTSWISSSTEIQNLKEEEKRKEDFLKLVSHELKTPVTSIKGYVQLLLSMLPKDNTEEDKKLIVKPYLNRIETQVERLIRLISEMLDLSRIGLEELEFRKEEFNLNEQVEYIVEDITYSNQDVQIEIEHTCQCDVYADKDRIGQVIINFITNALKYSPGDNKVKVRVYNQNENNVAVSVKDFGIGIAQEEQVKIFNRFYRVSGNKDETYAGFGIGLYLSNEIIERHHGEIFVNSEIGKGSEFTFTIPLNQN